MIRRLFGRPAPSTTRRRARQPHDRLGTSRQDHRQALVNPLDPQPDPRIERMKSRAAGLGISYEEYFCRLCVAGTLNESGSPPSWPAVGTQRYLRLPSPPQQPNHMTWNNRIIRRELAASNGNTELYGSTRPTTTWPEASRCSPVNPRVATTTPSRT